MKKYKAIVVILAILGIAAIIIAVLFIMLYGVITSTDPATQAILDGNQYIRSKYVNWKKIQLNTGGTLMIPEDWQFIQEGTDITFKNGEEIVAIGWQPIIDWQSITEGKGGNLDEQDREYNERLTDFLGFQPVRTETEEYSLMNVGQIGKPAKRIFYSDTDSKAILYTLFLFHFQPSECYYIWFGPLEHESDEALLEIVMAMAQSYVPAGLHS